MPCGLLLGHARIGVVGLIGGGPSWVFRFARRGPCRLRAMWVGWPRFRGWWSCPGGQRLLGPGALLYVLLPCGGAGPSALV